MQTADKLAVSQCVEHSLPHSGHHPHAGHHVGGISQLDANLSEGRTDRAHAEGNHIHGATWRQKDKRIAYNCLFFHLLSSTDLKCTFITVVPFMQPGNLWAMALSNSSGDIQRPNWLVPPPSGVGTVSLCSRVTITVLLSTLATSLGSVLANQL